MKNYEVTFIVDPVLSNDEIETTSKAYQTLVKDEGCSIVNVDRLGLKQLAYPINKRSSGVYYCIEFSGDTGAIIPKMELALRRDERIMRFLTVALDKYGVKYNEDKRAGKIGTVKKDKKEDKKEDKNSRGRNSRNSAKTPPPAAKKEEAAPVKKEEAAPVKKEEAAPVKKEVSAPAVVAASTPAPAAEVVTPETPVTPTPAAEAVAPVFAAAAAVTTPPTAKSEEE